MQKLIRVKGLNECSQGEWNFSLVAQTKHQPQARPCWDHEQLFSPRFLHILELGLSLARQ